MTNKEIINLLQTYRQHLLLLNSGTQYNYQKTREFLNKNRKTVQRILTAAGTFRLISIAPPPLYGGYRMNNVNPFDIIFNPPYNLDIYSLLSDVIEQAIGVIEGDADFYKKLEAKSETSDREYDIWALIHPSIAEVSRNRIKDGYYADAVEAACKAISNKVRDIVFDQTGEESDGANLMRKAFSPSNPIIQIASMNSRSGHDVQQGYMEIFAGLMTGIRNPKAHENETISKEDALRKLIMISMLMFKIDSRIVTE